MGRPVLHILHPTHLGPQKKLLRRSCRCRMLDVCKGTSRARGRAMPCGQALRSRGVLPASCRPLLCRGRVQGTMACLRSTRRFLLISQHAFPTRAMALLCMAAQFGGRRRMLCRQFLAMHLAYVLRTSGCMTVGCRYSHRTHRTWWGRLGSLLLPSRVRPFRCRHRQARGQGLHASRWKRKKVKLGREIRRPRCRGSMLGNVRLGLCQ